MQSSTIEQVLALTEHAAEGLMIHDDQGVVLFVNRRFAEPLGYSVAELLRVSMFELEARADEVLMRQIWSMMSHDHTVDLESHHRCKSGEVVVGRVRIRCVQEASRRCFLIAARQSGVPSDYLLTVTQELESSQARLMASEANYRALIHTTSDAIITFAWDTGFCLHANPAACRMFGYTKDDFPSVTGRDLAADPDPTFLSSVGKALTSVGRSSGRTRVRRKDGSTFWAEYTNAVYEALGRKRTVNIFRDVSDAVARERELTRQHQELRTAQARLLHADRLATIGQMAASIAHEINNPAAYVAANLTAQLAWLDQGSTSPQTLEVLRPMVEESLDGIQRIQATTRELKSFSLVDQHACEWLDLNDVVRLATKLSANALRHTANLRLDLGELPRLAGEPGKLAQLVVNLLINAAHALEHATAHAPTTDPVRGQVTVRTRTEANAVLLDVIDSGPGVDESVRASLFDPFVTTKPPGQGTGLGLSLCAQIAEAHRGGIQLVPSSVGAHFRVTIPLETGITPAPERGAPARALERRLRVLLVDDERLLLKAQRRLLAPDFDVDTAHDGLDALEKFVAGERYDLVICDLMMPNLDGPALRERALREFPSQAAVLHFCSGGAFTERTRRYLTENKLEVLDKPVTSDVLVELAQRVPAKS